MQLLKFLVLFDVVFETTNILWCLNMLPLFSFFLVTPLENFKVALESVVLGGVYDKMKVFG